MGIILKFNADKADELMLNVKEKIKEIDYNLNHIGDFTIKWYQHLKDKYGHIYRVLSEIRRVDTNEIAKVAEAKHK